MKGALLTLLVGLVLGAGGAFWLCRRAGDDVPQIQQELDAARVALAMEIQRSRARDTARARRDAIDDSLDRLHIREDSILLARLDKKPKRDTLWPKPESGGPAVPFPVVAAWEYDDLEQRCTAYHASCESRIDSLKQLRFDDGVELVKRSQAILDLQARLDSLPEIREPSRWSLGAGGGYGVVVSNGQLCNGPGVFTGINFSFR